MKNALIIFQKNPEQGKVKTRLAATVGDENALRIYSILVDKTHQLVEAIVAKKYLFFSDFIEKEVKWAPYDKKVQKGSDLGLRMFNAIAEVKAEGAERIVVIGTDCYDLSVDILEEAFVALETNDYCIGPALDGGYYLIGTTQPDEVVFLNKKWSTETVCEEAKDSILKAGKKVTILPILSDVDYEEDLKTLREFLV
ncbi:MAG: TIGR04282 family arsenosugar biosynthesis glycosyltransferase [Crocinitomicaceae bacterium]